MNVKINDRQLKILTIMSSHEEFSREDIQNQLKINVTDITIIRDLNYLTELKFLKTKGKTKQKKYRIDPSIWQWNININYYFQKDIDERGVLSKFNHDIFKKNGTIISPKEQQKITELSASFARRKNEEFNDIGFQKELERICIDLSWKSSQIEGNTYSLLETEELILHAKEAKGHTKEEAIMILNHKDAFDFLIQESDRFTQPSKKDLIDLHTILTKDLHIDSGIRSSLVGITGTSYRPLDNQWQIEEFIEAMMLLIHTARSSIEKSIIAHAITAYIQPFKDGNKRTSRMFSNGILMAYNMLPLSYRTVDDQSYKKAMLIFYETNNVFPLKQIMMEQFEFTSKNYF